MASIISSDISPRTQLVAGAGQTVFGYDFLVFAATDLKVYQHALNAVPNDADDLLTYNIDYTVQNKVLPEIGGTITLTTGATIHDRITIIRDMPEVRLNNYFDGGSFRAEDVDNDFDRCVLMNQTNSMFNSIVTPQYPVNAEIDIAKHKYLPLLPPLCSWRMNASGTGMEAFTLLPDGNGVVFPITPNTISIFDDASGTIKSSLFTAPAATTVNGSSVVAGDAGATQALQFATIPGKNLILNGDFRAIRRGTGFEINGAVQYGPEMWQLKTTAGTIGVFGLVPWVPDGPRALAYRIQRKDGNAGTNPIIFAQTISMTRCFNIGNKKLSIGFFARKSANFSANNSILRVKVISGSGTTFPTQDVSNINGAFFGPTTLLDTNKTLSTNDQFFHDTVNVPLNATQLYLEFSFVPVGVASDTDYFEITKVQAEVSDSPTPFEILTNTQLQHECNYYYRNTFLNGTPPASALGRNKGEWIFNAAFDAAVTNDIGYIPFDGGMRVTPAIRFYNPEIANSLARDYTKSVDCLATSVYQASPNGFSITVTGNGMTERGDALAVHFELDANLV